MDVMLIFKQNVHTFSDRGPISTTSLSWIQNCNAVWQLHKPTHAWTYSNHSWKW